MNRKQLIVAVIVILLLVVALAASVGTFLATAPTSEITYNAPASAVRASVGKTASSDAISLRLNGVSDASKPATRDTWVKFNLQSKLHNMSYNISLTPPPGERYLVANITVKNVQPTDVHFSYTAFAVLTPNNTAYYANFAVCNKSCWQALANRTLSAGFTSDLYVLFSVPEGTHADKVVYTTSKPPIVMSVA